MTNDPQEQAALQTVALGADAEAFMVSAAGQKLLGQMQAKAFEAMEKLKTIKRSDFASSRQFEIRINELQMEVANAENFEAWVYECIQDGRNTEQALAEMDE